MNRAVESLGEGLPRLDLAWPGRALRAGITLRAAAAVSDGRRDPALEGLRSWAARRFDGLVGGTQTHGSRIYETDGVRVPESTPREGPYLLRLTGYDGFLTRRPGTLLTVGVADCVPALLYAPGEEAVALLHAGWRGIAAGIMPAALALMERLGIRSETVLAWWGPAVAPCCYPVGEEVVEAIRSSGAGPAVDGWVHRTPEGPRVDLRAALSRQAEARGVPRSSISVSSYCTSCSAELFFSHRRERSRDRMLAFAGIPLSEKA
ncbi:MAG: polyphenol oxidase family protein [Gemmatimonadota bacterium]